MPRTKKKTGVKPKKKKIYFDLNKSLDELQGFDSGEPTYFSSLVVHYHQMRKKSLKDLTAWDISRFIMQNFDLEYLIPLALPMLEADPLLEVHYLGDLLTAVLYVPRSFWEAHPELRSTFLPIVEHARALLEEKQAVVKAGVEEAEDAWYLHPDLEGYEKLQQLLLEFLAGSSS